MYQQYSAEASMTKLNIPFIGLDTEEMGSRVIDINSSRPA